MAAPKTIKTRAGVPRTAAESASGKDPVTPLNLATLEARVTQLTNSLNEAISRFNAHTHGGVTAGAANTGAVSAAIGGGAGVAATNLFTTD